MIEILLKCSTCKIELPHTPEFFKCVREKLGKQCKECVKRTKSQYEFRIKYEVLLHYSNAKVPMCQCCPEYDMNFLTIDHVKGNGNTHRRQIQREKQTKTDSFRGGKFYRYLLDKNLPEGFRTLCYNCNNAYANGRTCPHYKNRLQIRDGYVWFDYNFSLEML